MTATALKNQNRERASHPAKKLNMETDEFLNMVTAYVLDAVERIVPEHNALTLPIEIEIRS